MNKTLDEVLRYALFPQDEADGRLNQTILNRLKEDATMKSYHKKRISTAVLVAILILCFSSITVYAVWKYISPHELAEELNNTKLADAFLSENAIVINETQSHGDYQVTLLSIVSGEDISNEASTHNGIIQNNRSYIVVAFEYIDGSPMPHTSEDSYADLEFCVSPLVKGYNPLDVNIFTLDGNYTDFSEDGILYRLLECDNFMILANYELYLSVSDTFTPDIACYHFDTASGVITRKEDYPGLNALFSLTLDSTFADDKAAATLLAELAPIENESSSDNTEDILPTESIEEETIVSDTPLESDIGTETSIYDWVSQLTPENISLYAEPVEHTIQILYPDADGYIETAFCEVEGRGSSGPSRISTSTSFKNYEVGKIYCHGCSHSGTFDTLKIDTFMLNADGSYTYAVYIPKQSP